MKKNLLTMAVCIVAMTLAAACSKQDTEQGGGKGVRSIASANINAEPQTRTEYDDQGTSLVVTWKKDESFKAYSSMNSTSHETYSTTNGSGKDALFTATWTTEPRNGTTLYAVYPNDEITTPDPPYAQIPVDLTGQTGMLNDLQDKNYMRATAQYNSTGTTKFSFSHRVAVVKLVLTFPEGVSGQATNVGLKADGLSNKANLNLIPEDNNPVAFYGNKKAGDVNTGTKAIAIGSDRLLTAYLCVFPGEELTQVKVTATVDGVNYEASLPDRTGDRALVAGKMYTVKKDVAKPEPELKAGRIYVNGTGDNASLMITNEPTNYGTLFQGGSVIAWDYGNESDANYNPTGNATLNQWNTEWTSDGKHSIDNLKSGKGDPCRLVGYTAKQVNDMINAIEPQLPDNKMWRLPTENEIIAFRLTADKWTINSEIPGYLFKDGSFLPATGLRSQDGVYDLKNTTGHYMSIITVNLYTSYWNFLIFDIKSCWGGSNKFFAHARSARCVRQ